VETVGAGQSEVEVIDISHTVVVTDVPGSGDDIQAIKAGIMEIADIFVVNKRDLPGAEKKATEINTMLDLDTRERSWRPPVMLTNSRKGEGIHELANKIIEHHTFLVESGEMETRGLQKTKDELKELMKFKLTQELLQKLQGRPEYEKAIKRIASRKEDPYSVAERLIAEFLFDESR
jgi:LAO/AO transport system kinase